MYHGFPLLDGVEFNGWRLGYITDLIDADAGDAFLVAPDDSRCGLVWDVSDRDYFEEIEGTTSWDRWGVFEISRARPVHDLEEAKEWLGELVNVLRPRWEAWRASGGSAAGPTPT